MYTNEDVWAAYEGFNNTLLDSNKYIYKTNSSYPSAVDRGNGAAAIWCQPIYCLLYTSGNEFFKRTEIVKRIFDRQYFFPIPQGEIDIDKNLVQNTGF